MIATLSANSGEAEIVLELGASAEYAHDPGFESSVRIRGQHWDGDHTYPLTASMAGLWLRAEDLRILREHIVSWTRRPLNRLRVEDVVGEFELARLPGQSIVLRFGSRTDTISHLNPVVTVGFSAGALRGEFHFLTDQSCLGLFADALPSAVAHNV